MEPVRHIAFRPLWHFILWIAVSLASIVEKEPAKGHDEQRLSLLNKLCLVPDVLNCLVVDYLRKWDYLDSPKAMLAVNGIVQTAHFLDGIQLVVLGGDQQIALCSYKPLGSETKKGPSPPLFRYSSVFDVPPHSQIHVYDATVEWRTARLSQSGDVASLFPLSQPAHRQNGVQNGGPGGVPVRRPQHAGDDGREEGRAGWPGPQSQ